MPRAVSAREEQPSYERAPRRHRSDRGRDRHRRHRSTPAEPTPQERGGAPGAAGAVRDGLAVLGVVYGVPVLGFALLRTVPAATVTVRTARGSARGHLFLPPAPVPA